MTRTYRNLYILYDGKLQEPLKSVPERLYEKKNKYDFPTRIEKKMHE